MTDFDKNLQTMLRALRLACGYSQAAVASALGVSRTAYTYYELGKVTPDLGALKRLAKIFGIPPEAFFYPEKYQSLAKARTCPPCPDPVCLGQLSAEEKALIARYRAGISA